jgi:hypothetical protein
MSFEDGGVPINTVASVNSSFSSNVPEFRTNRAKSIITSINEKIKKVKKITGSGRKKSIYFEVIDVNKSKWKTDCDFVATRRICIERVGYVERKRNLSILEASRYIKHIDDKFESQFKERTYNNVPFKRANTESINNIEDEKKARTNELLSRMSNNMGVRGSIKKNSIKNVKSGDVSFEQILDKTEMYDILELDYENDNLVVVDKCDIKVDNGRKTDNTKTDSKDILLNELLSNELDDDIKIQIFNVNNEGFKKEGNLEAKKIRETVNNAVEEINQERVSSGTNTSKLNSFVNNVKIEHFSVTLADIIEESKSVDRNVSIDSEQSPLAVNYRKKSLIVTNKNSTSQLAMFKNENNKGDYSREKLYMIKTRYSYCFVFLFYNNVMYSSLAKKLKIYK